MTSTEIKEMIMWLREQGAMQVNVEGVSAVFAQPIAREVPVEKEKIEVISNPFEDHVRSRFGVSAQELLGG